MAVFLPWRRPSSPPWGRLRGRGRLPRGGLRLGCGLSRRGLASRVSAVAVTPRRRPLRRRPRPVRFAQRGSGLAGGGLGALGLAGLAGGDRALAALAAAALPVGFTDATTGLSGGPADGGVILIVSRDLRRAAAFGMDRAGLGGAVERAQRFREGSGGVDPGRSAAARRRWPWRRTSWRRYAGVEDLATALRLADALETRRRARSVQVRGVLATWQTSAR